MNTKTCKKCNVTKPVSEFGFFFNNKDKLNRRCLSCVKAISHEYYKKNKEKIKEVNNTNRKINKAINSEYGIKERDVNKTKAYNKEYATRNKEHIRLRQAEYSKKNKEKRRVYEKTYRENDVLYYIKNRIRTLINISIRNKGYSKKSKTCKTLGCEFDFFKDYIESQFKEGMTWNNIHLDHIKPISTAKTEQEVTELNHYTNFQPLFAIDNLIKRDKIIEKQLRLL